MGYIKNIFLRTSGDSGRLDQQNSEHLTNKIQQGSTQQHSHLSFVICSKMTEYRLAMNIWGMVKPKHGKKKHGIEDTKW
jgi:ribosomal protein L37AE/L43A